MEEEKLSKMLKAGGGKTFFFDVKKAKDEKKYLTITESRFVGEGKERQRQSLIIFPEQIDEFIKIVSKMVDLIKE